MAKPRKGPGDYVGKVRDATSGYLRDLLSDNDTLRTAIAGLQAQRVRLEEQLLLLREDLERQQQEKEALEQRLLRVEVENRQHAEEFVRVEEQNNNLASLYVASYRLHGTLDRGEVVATIQDIVVNLVGCEDMGIYELSPEGGSVRLVAALGSEAQRHAEVPLGEGPIGRAAIAGEVHLGGEGDRPAACVPLVIDGRVTGMIVIFRLLEQKPGLEPLDRELFALLATHAATALYCTDLHASRVAAGRAG